MLIEGSLVSLRALETDDLPKLKEWRNKKHVRKSTREYRLLNMLNQKEWFESIHKNNPPREIMFGILDKKKKLIGVTGLTYIDWKNRNSEISIYISHEGWQERREAVEVLNHVMEYGFGELNMNRLWVEIYGNMKENIKLFEKMKFYKEGILRQKVWRNKKWWDSFIYSKLAREHHG
ncbi:MAG: GNAT family N-acetyltransferase [Nitrosarchaeum sp.]|nr:GNAT family N-acetyltransferase [Nitrosarchaeum sp.]MCA9819694.1 GNAT family N-acetyltransferase [Nitrosarchaeum sp.]